jgi:kynurenine formamidase
LNVAEVPKLHFPGLSSNAAKWLSTNRQIKAIGLDTPSIDYGQSMTFETHQILYTKNIPAFENVGDMTSLPLKGFWVIAIPMKIGGGWRPASRRCDCSVNQKFSLGVLRLCDKTRP